MEDIIQIIIDNVRYIVDNSSIFVALSMGFGIVILESIIPMLPLSIFIAINTIAFGNFFGFLISYIGTIIGCSLSYYIFKKLRKVILKKIKKQSKIKKFMNMISKVSFSKLVIILSIPFTPAFSINIAAGLANMPYKKYLLALIISKIFLVYFWGFIGTTMLQSITDIEVIIKLIILIFVSFILSKIVIKRFNIT